MIEDANGCITAPGGDRGIVYEFSIMVHVSFVDIERFKSPAGDRCDAISTVCGNEMLS